MYLCVRGIDVVYFYEDFDIVPTDIFCYSFHDIVSEVIF